MKSETKAKLVTALLCALLCLLCSDIVGMWPAALPYILGAFAVPGIWKFARVLYIWLLTEDPEPIAWPAIRWPWKKKQPYQDYAEAPKK